MTDKLLCPFCQQELQEDIGYDGDYSCPNCREPYFGSPELWQALIDTKEALEQSETCCTEWEKQALDYKAENIALSGDLERTRKALDAAVDGLGKMTWGCDSSDAEYLLKEIEKITALEQKDVK